MKVQLPRLTTSLRDPCDVDRAYIDRKRILQSLDLQRITQSSDESELGRKIIPKWDGGYCLKDEIHIFTYRASCKICRAFYSISKCTNVVLLGDLIAGPCCIYFFSDLADWLGVGDIGLFNFKPSVRPVPLEVHIQGYPGKFYCPRMNSMNKPAYAAICTHSPTKRVLIFVSSRRQTRLTTLDLIQFATDERPRQFLNMSAEELEMVLFPVTDMNLRHTLQFGIGLHHAGLSDRDRALVEELFANNKIQVLVSTSTLAWGVNLPAHLVIIKGTEYYDGKTKRYVDFPITDILQMMGRAGRPQYDQQGKAVILVHEPKKSFYKKFLYEPFPVESCLKDQLHDNFNAEIVSGTICNQEDAVHYLTWTYLFRRLDMSLFPRVQAKVWLQHNDAEVLNRSVNIRLENLNSMHKTTRAFAPRFPKVKEEAWWLILGDTATSELYSLKRVSLSKKLVTHMDLPSEVVDLKDLKLILVFDCYLGYELEYAIC